MWRSRTLIIEPLTPQFTVDPDQWATDVYAGVGTPVKLRIPIATGKISFSWGSATGSCGQSTRVNVLVDGSHVGAIYFTHLAGAIKSGVITNNMVMEP